MTVRMLYLMFILWVPTVSGTNRMSTSAERRSALRRILAQHSRECADDAIGSSSVTRAGESLRLHRQVRWRSAARRRMLGAPTLSPSPCQ